MVLLRSLLSQSYQCDHEHGIPHSLTSVNTLLVSVNLYVRGCIGKFDLRLPDSGPCRNYWLDLFRCLMGQLPASSGNCTSLYCIAPRWASRPRGGEEADLVDPAPFTYSHRSGKDGAPEFNTPSGRVWGTMLYSVWQLIGRWTPPGNFVRNLL